jgi:ElaB/YqjD/DUF883 family membrane-anchored ribosome-binding protein
MKRMRVARPFPQPQQLQQTFDAPGQALPEATQRAYAPLFSHDLSKIKIHADSRAHESAEALEARAFTYGPNIVFGRDEYDPYTPRGQQTILHELAHTAQQGMHTPELGHDLGFASATIESQASGFARGDSSTLSAAPATIARLRTGEEDGDPSQLNRAALLEVAAHGLAYERFDRRGNWIPQETDPEKARAERQRRAYYMQVMRDAGYDVNSSRSVEGANGFGMRSFLPNARDPRARELSPIVAFRGTETSMDGVADDLVGADTNPEGIGADQFARNRALIRAQMAAAARTGNGQLTLSGHSLGGALAQQAAADQPNLVQDVTTFQSPGVMRGVAAQFDQGNAARVAAGMAPMTSTHFRASDMDIVPWAGSAMTRGTVQTFDPVEGATPLDHMAFPLLSRALRRGEGTQNLQGDALNGMRDLRNGEHDFSSNQAFTRTSDAANGEGFGFSEAARRAAGSYVWDPVRAAATTVGGLATPFGLGAVGINQALPDGNLTSAAMEGGVNTVRAGWNSSRAQGAAAANGLEAYGNERWDTWQGRATRGMNAAQGASSEVWGGINKFGGRRADALERRGRQFNALTDGYIPEAVTNTLRGTWNDARSLVSDASDAIGDTTNAVVARGREIAGNTADTARNAVRGTWNEARSAVSRGANHVEQWGRGAGAKVNDAAQYIRENPIAIAGYRRARAGISQGVDAARNVYNNVSNTVTDTASRGWSATRQAASGVGNAVTNGVSSAWNWLTED